MRGQGRGQALLDRGQLAEIVVAHQDQALTLLQPVNGPHQGVQPAGEERHRLGPPGVGPGSPAAPGRSWPGGTPRSSRRR